jgi:PAS domain S-box-containing protein
VLRITPGFALPPDQAAILADPARLGAIARLRLLEPGWGEALGSLTRVASAVTGAPAALLSIVTDERQYFKSQVGLPGGLTETPLSQSYCRHVVSGEAPLIVEDAPTDLGVRAYLGFPVHAPDGSAIGSFCVLDFEPRAWVDADVELVRELAAVATSEIAARETQLALAVSEERHRALLQGLRVIVWEGEPGVDSCSFVSEAAERLLGYTAEQWCGERGFWRDHLHPDDRERAVAESEAAVADGRDHTLVYRMLAADGRAVWIRDVVSVVRGPDGAPAALRGAMSDITAERDTETRYRVLVENARFCTYRQDTRSQLEYISPQVEELVGYPAGRWLEDRDGSFFASIVHPDDRDEVVAAVAESRAARCAFSMEYRLLTPDGRTVWVHDETIPAADADGTVVLRQGFLMDVTARRTAEDRYRRVVDSSNDLIVLISRDGRIELASESHRPFGLQPEKLVGARAVDIVHLDDVPHVVAAASAVLDGSPPITTQMRFARPDGTLRWFESTFSAIGDGAERLILVVGRDVTERIELEAERERYAQQLHLLAEASIRLAEAHGPQEALSLAAEQARRVVGSEQAVARLCAHAGPAPAGERLAAPLVSRDGETLGVVELIGKSGGFTVSDEAVLAQLAQAAAVSLERAQLEQRLLQAQKMEAIGQFAGGVAHDFNNLLTAIGGYAELAERRELPAEARAAVEQIREASARAGDLTRQLLAFSRKHVVAPETLDVAEVAQEYLPMLARLIGEDVRIELERDPETRPVLADRGRLGQVLVNLAANARDALPAGGRLTIRTEPARLARRSARHWPELAPGDYTALVVADDGVGMEAATLKHVLEPFFTTKSVGNGTGLGLATVHRIVTDAGGAVRIESAPDAGTTVTILLPVCTGRVQAREPRNPPAAPRGHERVLLVEDQDVVRDLVVQMLEGDGYEVTVAETPAKALALADAPIDVLVTDVVMPELSGPQLAERLRRDRPGLPVLYTSGYTDAALDGDVGAAAGFLQKPFGHADLARALRELLDRA